MKIEVGKTYVDRQGAHTRITKSDPSDAAVLGVDADGETYTFTLSGHFISDDHVSPYDLVAEAPAAPEPPSAPTFPPRQADGTINPKDAAALRRVPLHIYPPVGHIYGTMACLDGARKYGPYNWRERSISLTQYVGAMLRHLHALLDGEDDARDSGLPHLAHVNATSAIMLDAKAAGALLDDRPRRSGGAADLIAELNARIAAEADE